MKANISSQTNPINSLRDLESLTRATTILESKQLFTSDEQLQQQTNQIISAKANASKIYSQLLNEEKQLPEENFLDELDEELKKLRSQYQAKKENLENIKQERNELKAQYENLRSVSAIKELVDNCDFTFLNALFNGLSPHFYMKTNDEKESHRDKLNGEDGNGGKIS